MFYKRFEERFALERDACSPVPHSLVRDAKISPAAPPSQPSSPSFAERVASLEKA